MKKKGFLQSLNANVYEFFLFTIHARFHMVTLTHATACYQISLPVIIRIPVWNSDHKTRWFISDPKWSV